MHASRQDTTYITRYTVSPEAPFSWRSSRYTQKSKSASKNQRSYGCRSRVSAYPVPTDATDASSAKCTARTDGEDTVRAPRVRSCSTKAVRSSFSLSLSSGSRNADPARTLLRGEERLGVDMDRWTVSAMSPLFSSKLSPAAIWRGRSVPSVGGAGMLPPEDLSCARWVS